MKKIILSVVLSISYFFSLSVNASQVNICLLTGTLLADPQIAIMSFSPSNDNGKTLPEREYNNVELEVLVTAANITETRADSLCALPNNQPYKITVSLRDEYSLNDAKKGEQIKLLHIYKNYPNGEDEDYILQN